jgi:hypothetical protein
MRLFETVEVMDEKLREFPRLPTLDITFSQA